MTAARAAREVIPEVKAEKAAAPVVKAATPAEKAATPAVRGVTPVARAEKAATVVATQENPVNLARLARPAKMVAMRVKPVKPENQVSPAMAVATQAKPVSPAKAATTTAPKVVRLRIEDRPRELGLKWPRGLGLD